MCPEGMIRLSKVLSEENIETFGNFRSFGTKCRRLFLFCDVYLCYAMSKIFNYNLVRSFQRVGTTSMFVNFKITLSLFCEGLVKVLWGQLHPGKRIISGLLDFYSNKHWLYLGIASKKVEAIALKIFQDWLICIIYMYCIYIHMYMNYYIYVFVGIQVKH